MPQPSFAARLQRELKRNPKKTAVLGLVSLVALWFWAPLVAGWLGGDESLPDAEVQIVEEAPAAAAGSATASPVRLPAWETLVEWIDLDRRSRHPVPAATRRDPFRPARPDEPAGPAGPLPRAEAAPQPPRAEPPERHPAPEELGLALRSTIVAGAAGSAQIGRFRYRVGDELVVELPGGTEGPFVFRLLAIHPRHVVLEREGRRYELHLPRRELARGDRIGSGDGGP